MLTKEQSLGMVRHVLTLAGGWWIAKGAIDENTMTQLIGAAMTIIGFVWSYTDKKK